MSKKLKMPEKGLFGLPSSVRQTNEEEESAKNQIDNTQKTSITAKRLDVEDTSSLGDVESSGLGDEDTIPQNVQESSGLADQETNKLDAQEIIHQNSQATEKLDDKTSKRQKGQTSKRLKVENLNSQTTRHLDAIPLDEQTASQLEVKPQNADPSELHVDETLKQLSDEATDQLDGETPKKKKAKSASLVKKTYYIDHDLDGAIELMAVLQKGDQSDIVRQLLRSAIPEYYLTQWKIMSEHSK
ncbi:hypothetical protein [Desulfosporosinus sp.]|uniref:hypothetical protein n=1 Tax=Desulfosporosinus sp. TaxID=157907 RepID=UPI002627B61D|nr:hypothetical protein [Desulfosporosinus sp.]